MTNEEHIRTYCNITDLAKYLIIPASEITYDYDWDENLINGPDRYYYVTSDGEEFDDYDEALAQEIWWLNQEHKEEKE